MADFVTDFVADCVTDFGVFLSFKSVGKSFGGTQALLVMGEKLPQKLYIIICRNAISGHI